MKILLRIILICWIAIASAGQSQKATLTGRVTHRETGQPIAGANVLLLGTMMGAATDDHGRFEMRVPAGNYDVLISAIGYTQEERTIRLASEQEMSLNFELEEAVIMMEGVAVTASRYEQSINDIPVSLELIPAKEILERNITSVDQALKYVPGVNTLEGGQIAIRGSSGFNWGVGSRVLVLLNGNPMMGGDIRDVNWQAIPTANIKQVEVMKGSGSALYGSSAMGGVVNIITEEPQEGNHFRIQTFTGFYNEPSHPQWQWTDDARHFEGTAVNFSTHLGPVSTSLTSSFKSNTSYRENDDQQNFNFTASLGYHLNPNIRFDLLTGHTRKSGGFFIYWEDLVNPYANGSDPEDFRTRNHRKYTFVYPSISYVINERLFLLIKGRYYLLDTEDHLESRTPGRADDPLFRASEALTQGGEMQLNWQLGNKGMLVAGATIQADEVQSIQYGHRRISQASYFSQFEHRFWKWLNLSLGSRYDYEEGNDIKSSGKLSNKLGVTASLSPATHLRLSYAEGFRTPAIGERFVSTSTGGLRVSPNPDLKPERSVSAEFGVRHAFSNVVNLDAAVFFAGYNDLIEPQLDSNNGDVVVRFKNVAKARIRGLDLSIRAQWMKRASSRIGYTLLDTEDLSPGNEGEPLKYRSRHIAYISSDYNLLPFTTGIDFRYLSKIERIDAYHRTYIRDIENVVPTYVVSFRLSFVQKHYSIRLLIDNVFQYNYLSAPANMGPPRTVTLQLNVTS